MLTSRHVDPSIFIIAGDHYVDPARLDSPIAIAPDSLGYDGQFFYRLALDPFSFQPTAHGITFDDPAKRSARIVYPLLAWLVSLGQPRLVPAALLLVNLAGLAALAASASWLTRRLALPSWLPFAILAWPGWLITLTDDTAEIVATALLLSALAAYLSNRLLLFAPLAAAATLTRETTLPIFVGLFAFEVFRATLSTSLRGAQRRGNPGQQARSLPMHPLAMTLLALLPFALWRELAGVGQRLGGSPDLGWPLAGAIEALVADLDGSRTWSSDWLFNLLARIFVVATTGALFAFCLAVARRLPRLIRRSDTAGLALGWALTLFLMSLLTADQSWLDPHGYFRAFTETYVLGCLLLAISATHVASRTAISAGALAALSVGFFNWLWCLSVLP